MTRTYTTTLTRLTRFVFVAMLVGLTTTGCGLVDSNAIENELPSTTLFSMLHEVEDSLFVGPPLIIKDPRLEEPPEPVDK